MLQSVAYIQAVTKNQAKTFHVKGVNQADSSETKQISKLTVTENLAETLREKAGDQAASYR